MPHRNRGPRVPGVFTCSVLLTVMATALRAFGLRRALRLARALSERGLPVGPVLNPQLIGRTATQVARVAAFYPGRAECLEQSLTLLVLLRRRGIEAELRIGVEAFPFSAHAWVEHRGRPVNESAEFVERLAAFSSLGG